MMTEVDASSGIGPSAGGTESDMEQLCKLGYVTGPDCEGINDETVGDEEDAGEVLHLD